MSDELRWLVGLAATGIIALVTTLIASFRALSGRIEATARVAKDGDDQLHERVNRVRDEYVKRVDLDGHMSRMETNVKEQREETRQGMREINRRLDQLMSTLQPSSDRRHRATD